MSGQAVIAIMGPTCAGKSTFLGHAIQTEPDRVGLVEVGKMLRAKYPPSYFEGQAAPAKTQVEAWDMCEGRIRDHVAAGKTITLVDGQPRSHDQVIAFMRLREEMPDVRFYFLLLTATEEERQRRATSRFKPDEDRYQEKVDLAMARIKNDMLTYYRVLTQLMAKPFEQQIEVVDTTEGLDLEWLLSHLLAVAMGNTKPAVAATV